jgi:hypothetical protein
MNVVMKRPINGEDITAQVSMTGLTILKEMSLRKRTTGSKQYVEHGTKGFITKKESDALDALGKKVKRPKKVNVITAEPIIKKVRRNKEYKINKKQITHRIKNFVNQLSGEKKLYFWTITFPEGTSDNTGFKLLNIWLTRVRKELNLRSYLWISERQQNGTIHFHLTFHQRICVKKANRFMRAAIFNEVKEGNIKFSRKDAKNYNGVDIAKDRKTKRVTNFAKQSKAKSLSNYLTKYVTKNNSTFAHLAWHCSRDYSNLVIALNVTLPELERFKIKDLFTTTAIFENEFFSFYPWLDGPDISFLSQIGTINQYIVNHVNTHNK